MQGLYDPNNPLMVSAEILGGVIEAAAELKIDISDHLDRNGIKISQISNPKGVLAYHQIVNFLEDTASHTGCHLLGFHIARHQRPMRFGAIAQLPKLCATIGESIEKGLLYSELYNQESLWEFKLDNKYAFMKRHHRVHFQRSQQQLHLLAITLMIKASHDTVGDTGKISLISFSSARPNDSEILSRYFHVPVYFDQDYDGYAFPQSLLSLPIPSSNPELLSIVESHLQGLLKLQLSPTTLATQTHQLIQQHIGTNTCSVEGIARLMGRHPRTLQRALKSENTNFRELLNIVRQRTAEYYLTSSDIRLSDLSDILGYQNVSAFSRAFKAASGISPETWKQKNRNSS